MQNNNGLLWSLGIAVFGFGGYFLYRHFKNGTVALPGSASIVPTGDTSVVVPKLDIPKVVRAKFHRLTKTNRIRGRDKYGSGHFGAKQGSKTHNGVDIMAGPGEHIFSPIDGKIVRYAYPFSDKSYAGLALQNREHFIKIFYLAPTVRPGDTIRKGQTIGMAQNIGVKYPGIIPHVHFEVWDRSKVNMAVDPTHLFLS